MQPACFTTLLGIQGFQVTAIEQTTAVPRSVILVHMERIKEGYVCGECGQAAPGCDHTWQTDYPRSHGYVGALP